MENNLDDIQEAIDEFDVLQPDYVPPARGRGRPRIYQRFVYGPLEVDEEAINFQRRQEAIALWNTDRRAAQAILRRQEYPQSIERRNQARRDHVLRLPPRVYMPQIRLAPHEIPAAVSVPTYRNLEAEQPGLQLQRRGGARTDIVDRTTNRRLGEIFEYQLNRTGGPLPPRTVNRIFGNQDTVYVFRRFLFEANLPPEVDGMSNADKAWNLGQLVFSLIRYSLMNIFGLANDLAGSLNARGLEAQIQNREMWSSIMLHKEDGSRYSGFRVERVNEEDTIRRIGEFLAGQSEFNLGGDLKIELQFILKVLPRDQGRNWDTQVFDNQTPMRGYREGEQAAQPSRFPLPPQDEDRGNWRIMRASGRLARPRQEDAVQEPPLPVPPARLGRVRREVDPSNIIEGPRMGRGVRIAGYDVLQTFDSPFRDLASERDWTIVQPTISDLHLSKASLDRVNHFHRKRVEDVFIPFGKFNYETATTNVQVGAYELMEPHTKLFFQQSIMKMYAKDGSVIFNPETDSFSCFLMAFLRAQCIQYTFSAGSGQFIEAEPVSHVMECLLPEWSNLQQDYPFVHYDVEQENFYLQLFNTEVRGVTEDGTYPTNLDALEVEYWEIAARELEYQLFRLVGEWRNVNDLGEIGQLISTMHNVIIQVYDIQISNKRTWIFVPDSTKTIGQMMLENEGKIQMVSLLYDQGHMIPIRSLRKFLTFHNKHDLKKNAYCLFCEQHGGQDMKTREKIQLHLTNCAKRFQHEKWCCYTTKPLGEEEIEYAIKPIHHRFIVEEKQVLPCCIYCQEHVCQEEFMDHRCFIHPRRDPKEERSEECFYVYDIEAAQISIPETNLSYHICNMLVLRKMYPQNEEEKQGMRFDNEYKFMEFVMEDNRMKGAVIIAHNGGSYDHHFIVRYLERLRIPHSFIPTPNSLHKFLSVTITSKDITFLDFIHFMPGSLKGISESLGLSLGKGDFPHRFNRSEDISYRGCIPPIDTEDDFWCLKTKKSEKDIEELKEFYTQQCLRFCDCPGTLDPKDGTFCLQCGKELWVMEQEMYYYCKRDVDVLAEACATYRNQLLELGNESNDEVMDTPWEASSVEPFDFMTVPQLALQILLKGFAEPIFRNSMDKIRKGQTLQGLVWIQTLMNETGKHILQRQNYHKEYYDYEIKQFADGYCEETGEIFVCLDCDVWACENCHFHNIYSMEEHPQFPRKTYMDVWTKTREVIDLWRSKGAYVIFACEIQMDNISPYLQKCLTSKSMASFFYGGRTEVFQPYFKTSPDQSIEYHDVCSLYPYVCAFKELPFGIPEYIPGFQVEMERLFHRDPNQKYWGYIRARVRPRTQCLLGLLPQRNEDGRLLFSLEPQEGCWGLEEMELAVSEGYILEEVYEIIHWGPHQRSNQLFRGYVDFFLRMKQQSEGWKKLGGHENMTEEEQHQLVEQLYISNGYIGKIDPSKVAKNPTRRALAKLFLNSLWGKFAQKPKAKRQGIIYTAEQFVKLWCDKSIRKESIIFRETGVGIFKYECELESFCTKENAKGNLFLAAKVTEHARCVLHRQMIKIGPERVLYCDTDSIIFVWSKNGQDLTGIGLGKWTDEHPNEDIVEFLALAPKFYMLVYASDDSSLKVKGVQLTVENTNKLTAARLKEMLWNDWRQVEVAEKRKHEDIVEVEYMSIFSNCQQNRGVNYGVMMTRYGKKAVQVVLSKRNVVRSEEARNTPLDSLVRIWTTPFGYS
jgi:hypothetical protein